MTDDYPVNEAGLVKRIVAAIEREWPSAWIFKTHGGPMQRAGVPDLLVSVGGRLVALEVKHRKPGESVKRMGARVTVRQQAEIQRLRDSGATVSVVWTVEQALGVTRSATT